MPIPPLIHHNSHVIGDIFEAEVFNAYFSCAFTVDQIIALIFLSYRKIYSFNHLLFKLLNLMLRRYVMSYEIWVVTRPVVQTYYQPVYSRWVLNLLLLRWHTCFNYHSLLANFLWTGLVQTLFLFTKLKRRLTFNHPINVTSNVVKIMERIISPIKLWRVTICLMTARLPVQFSSQAFYSISPSTRSWWLDWITWP